MKFVDISYYYNNTSDPESLLLAHGANLGYLDFLPADWETYLIKFLHREGQLQFGRTQFHFFKGNTSPLWVPGHVNRFIANLKPDVVLFHGLIYPLQLMMLGRQLGDHTKIIVQHHAELPGRELKGRLQKLAARYIHAYVFAAKELSHPWVEKNIVPAAKIFEVMEGSTNLQHMDKQAARQYLNLHDDTILLWVGRLNANKDPLTVLNGFEKFLQTGSKAKLYMIFQNNELLPIVERAITESKLLANAVVLTGKVEKEHMAHWYNAADVYVSGSRSEGSGYALIEAMSCGCIPVVTDIPSFRKITANGKAGLLYACGDADALCGALARLGQMNKEQLSANALLQFSNELSFNSIAKQIVSVYDRLR